VVGQTIGIGRLEVIAVDDGSTDGSGTLLDGWAERYSQITVVREPNSGGPGRPRNIGLDRATGTYVFFLDADDYLGPEALERLVAMADRNGTDIVLGRMVGVGGRRVSSRAFARNRDRASLEQAFVTTSVLKLFRRSLLEGLALRFEEGLSGHEDGQFTTHAYFHASGVSIVADYDCYFVHPKSRTRARVAPSRWLRIVAERIDIVASHTRPGLRRRMLMTKNMRQLVSVYASPWLQLPVDERRRLFDEGSRLAARWLTSSMMRSLDPPRALRAYCLRHGLAIELEDIVACPRSAALGDPIVEGRHVYARYPHFRDDARIPDRYFELTKWINPRITLRRIAVVGKMLELAGAAHLTYIGGFTNVLLRGWPVGPTYRFDTTSLPTPDRADDGRPHPSVGFASSVDLSTAADGRPLGKGTWDVILSVGTNGFRRSTRLVGERGRANLPAAVAADVTPAGEGFALYVSRAGHVRLRAGAASQVTRWIEIVEAAWVTAAHRAKRAVQTSRWGPYLGFAIGEQSVDITADLH
jgi:CDP-glycerol glycerophosphotransferase